MTLSKKDRNVLLSYARKVIDSYLKEGKAPSVEIHNKALLECERGAFVSLHKDHELRGCIGVFTSNKQLYETISEIAITASTKDPRFEPLTLNELPDTTIEISVLTPLKKIKDISEVEVGRHGIFITKDGNRGVLLPQVATEYDWDRDTFLAHTCLKAGLSPYCWKEELTEIYIFEAEVFREDRE